LLSPADALMMQSAIRGADAFDLPLPGFLADHAPINYSTLVWNCYDKAAVAT
jgi:hypothetical protein